MILRTGKDREAERGTTSKTGLRMIANAAGGLLPSLAEQLKESFGAVILPSYGMTECMPISTPPADYKLDRPGTSGVAVGPELCIGDPNDARPLDVGETGNIMVRGAPTMQGYENNAAANAEVFRTNDQGSGWFDTGDMGNLD